MTEYDPLTGARINRFSISSRTSLAFSPPEPLAEPTSWAVLTLALLTLAGTRLARPRQNNAGGWASTLSLFAPHPIGAKKRTAIPL